jgi:hypothetical protein
MDYDYDKRLIALVDDLPISLRPWNCLLHADIEYVG